MSKIVTHSLLTFLFFDTQCDRKGKEGTVKVAFINRLYSFILFFSLYYHSKPKERRKFPSRPSFLSFLLENNHGGTWVTFTLCEWSMRLEVTRGSSSTRDVPTRIYGAFTRHVYCIVLDEVCTCYKHREDE